MNATRTFVWLFLALTTPSLAQEDVPSFGTTVVLPFGLRGEIFELPKGTLTMPKFEKLEPIGVIYTSSLNIKPRHFTDGFPGVTNRFEWFGIDYNGRFWIDTPGRYDFSLVSDDGSMLYIDGQLVIDNGKHHPPTLKDGHTKLSGGIHTIRISYFQGPRDYLALILGVRGPKDKDWRIFSTDQFKPPVHPEDWKFGSTKDLDTNEPNNAGRKKLKDVIKK